jgi:hypothetical protein
VRQGDTIATRDLNEPTGSWLPKVAPWRRNVGLGQFVLLNGKVTFENFVRLLNLKLNVKQFDASVPHIVFCSERN